MVHTFCTLSDSLFIRAKLEVSDGAFGILQKEYCGEERSDRKSITSGNGQNSIHAFCVQQIFCFFNRLRVRGHGFPCHAARNCRNTGSNIAAFGCQLAELFSAMENVGASVQAACAAISPFKGRKNICLRIQTAQDINRQKTTIGRKYKI